MNTCGSEAVVIFSIRIKSPCSRLRPPTSLFPLEMPGIYLSGYPPCRLPASKSLPPRLQLFALAEPGNRSTSMQRQYFPPLIAQAVDPITRELVFLNVSDINFFKIIPPLTSNMSGTLSVSWSKTGLPDRFHPKLPSTPETRLCPKANSRHR